MLLARDRSLELLCSVDRVTDGPHPRGHSHRCFLAGSCWDHVSECSPTQAHAHRGGVFLLVSTNPAVLPAWPCGSSLPWQLGSGEHIQGCTRSPPLQPGCWVLPAESRKGLRWAVGARVATIRRMSQLAGGQSPGVIEQSTVAAALSTLKVPPCRAAAALCQGSGHTSPSL